tara:strand:+ start:2586 stop:3677 length:1092 start_codon:yes stop_codon:yes gene_type:complete
MIKYIIILLILIILLYTLQIKERFYNLNYLKKKYILDNINIGYYLDKNSENDDTKIVKFLAKNLIKENLLVYTTIVKYTNIKQLISAVLDKANLTNFMIIDDITINNKYLNNTENINFSNLRFVTPIEVKCIFPLVNITSRIGSMYDVKKIGILEGNIRNKYVAENFAYIIRYKTLAKMEIITYKDFNSMMNGLNKSEIDIALYLNYEHNKIIENMFIQNQNINIGILNNDLNYELINTVFKCYNQQPFELRNVKNYLPRKIKENYYTYYLSNINIFTFQISLFTNLHTKNKVIYNIKKYFYYKETKTSSKFSNFSNYFLNHPEVNRFLKHTGIISYNKNPLCSNIEGECTDKLLNIVRNQMF